MLKNKNLRKVILIVGVVLVALFAIRLLPALIALTSGVLYLGGLALIGIFTFTLVKSLWGKK